MPGPCTHDASIARSSRERLTAIEKKLAEREWAGRPTRSPIRRNRSPALDASARRSMTIGVFVASVSSAHPSAVAAASSSRASIVCWRRTRIM